MKPNPLDYASPRPPEPGRRTNPWVAVSLAVFFLLLVFIIRFVIPALPRPETIEWERIQVAKADLSKIEAWLEAFRADTGRFPTAAEGLGGLVNPPAGLAGWKGPYLKRVPMDPWGRPYIYHYRDGGSGGGYAIGCLGPDGEAGTADDIGSPYDPPATVPAATQPDPPAR